MKKRQYSAPLTGRVKVEMDEGFMQASEKLVDPVKSNVEVDDWVSVDNDVTFE